MHGMQTSNETQSGMKVVCTCCRVEIKDCVVNIQHQGLLILPGIVEHFDLSIFDSALQLILQSATAASKGGIRNLDICFEDKGRNTCLVIWVVFNVQRLQCVFLQIKVVLHMRRNICLCIELGCLFLRCPAYT